MKSLKLFLLIPLLGLASSLFSANIWINGKVTENGVGKPGIQVIWLDSTSNKADTVMTDSAGNYTSNLNIGSTTQGMAIGYINDCNQRGVYQTMFYNPSSSTYTGLNFVYCTSTSKPPFTSTVSGSLYYLGTSSATVYWDTLGGAFANGSQSVTATNSSYSFSIVAYASPQDVWVYLVDCKNDTIMKKVTVTTSNPTVSNVNFNYCKPSVPYATVAGSVFTGNTLASNAIVLLIEKDSNMLTAVDTSNVAQGRYSFTLPDSSKQYLVKAILLSNDPNYSSYLPTYADSSLFWSSAFVLPPGNNTTYALNIHMKQGTNTSGPGFVGGNVNQGANAAAGVGDPIEGVLVMLLQNNELVAFTESDANGDFKIENLPVGTYTVYAEVMGKTTLSLYVYITPENPKVEGVKISVNDYSVTTKIETVSSVSDIANDINIKVYPNPAIDLVTVDFGVSMTSSVTLINTLGNVVFESEITNEKETTISLREFPQGNYLLKIEGEEGIDVLRILKK